MVIYNATPFQTWWKSIVWPLRWQFQKAGNMLQVSGLSSQLLGHRSQVTGHRSQVPGHRSLVMGLMSEVTNLKKIVIAHTANILALVIAHTAAGLRSEVTNLKKNVIAHTADELELTLFNNVVDGSHSTSVKYLGKHFSLYHYPRRTNTATASAVSLPWLQRYLHRQPFSTQEEILLQGLTLRLVSDHCTLYCPFSPSKWDAAQMNRKASAS